VVAGRRLIDGLRDLHSACPPDISSRSLVTLLVISALASLSSAAPGAAAQQASAADPPAVQTDRGVVVGKRAGTVDEFLGIPLRRAAGRRPALPLAAAVRVLAGAAPMRSSNATSHAAAALPLETCSIAYQGHDLQNRIHADEKGLSDMSDWDLLLLWPLVGWICGAVVWTDRFHTSDLPGMLLFCGVSGPLVLLVRPLCRLMDHSPGTKAKQSLKDLQGEVVGDRSLSAAVRHAGGFLADQHPACGKASKNAPPTRTTAG
jgi:hypothetical protein